jgi:hypothetical protein
VSEIVGNKREGRNNTQIRMPRIKYIDLLLLHIIDKNGAFDLSSAIQVFPFLERNDELAINNRYLKIDTWGGTEIYVLHN